MRLRIVASTAALAFAVAVGSAQQLTSMTGDSSVTGASSLGARSQFTNVWAFSPPSSGNDNTYFRGAVMPQPQVAGVSLILAWSRVETSPPQAAPPCSTGTAPDQQQVDSIGMYHCYDWTTYDSTAAGNLVMQWFDSFGGSPKLVNLLFSGIATGAVNNTTPNYVTTSSWYTNSGFASGYNRQDVINAIKDCTAVPYIGTSAAVGNVSWTGTTVKVNATGCCSTSTTDQSSLIHNGDTIWVTGTASGINSAVNATAFGITTADQFSYTSAMSAGTTSAVTYITASQSWPVPYELPYQVALQPFWAAAIAHYAPNSFAKSSQLNYFRFGGSAGSEWYPYCVTNSSNPSDGLSQLSSPYKYVKSGGSPGTTVGWLDYYSQMTGYLQSLQPAAKVIMSINSAETGPIDYTYADTEAGYAVQHVNAYGVAFGFGSQGLSALDYVNCTSPNSCGLSAPVATRSASDWNPLFNQYRGLGTPLELQTLSLSYEGDTDCSSPVCGPGNGKYSGDLPTFLYPFATNAGLTDVELYWRDLDLAYDAANYCVLSNPPPPFSCTSGISLGGQLTSGQWATFFQDVGQAKPMLPNTCVAGFPYQSNAGGNCAYATNVNSADGPH